MTRGPGVPEVVDFAEQHRDAVIALAGDPRWSPLRYLALFGHDVGGAEQADRVRSLLGQDGWHLVALDGAQVVGQVSAVPVDDLTEHFGVPFVEVGPLLTIADQEVHRRQVVRSLLSALRDTIGGDPAALCFVRVEADDHEAVAAAEDAGYRLRETTLTYVNDLARRDRNLVLPRPDGGIRVHRFGTDDRLPSAAFDVARSHPAPVTVGHYHADPRLSDDRCDALYRRVLRRVLDGVGADVLVMQFVDEELVGFGSWRNWDRLRPYGVAMVGSSFGFRMPGAPMGLLGEVGAYVCNEPLTENRLLEWSTQAPNYPMINMLSRQQSIRLCRVSQVLHGWTDSADA